MEFKKEENKEMEENVKGEEVMEECRDIVYNNDNELIILK